MQHRPQFWSLLCSKDADQRAQGRFLAFDTVSEMEARALIAQADGERHLRELEDAIGKAEQKGAYTAVASMLKQRAQLLGLDQPSPPPEPSAEAVEPPADPKEHRRQLLLVCRRARLQAESSGSWVAAAKYLAQEKELLAEMPNEGGPALSDEELLSGLREALRSLPPDLLAELIDQVTGAAPDDDDLDEDGGDECDDEEDG